MLEAAKPGERLIANNVLRHLSWWLKLVNQRESGCGARSRRVTHKSLFTKGPKIFLKLKPHVTERPVLAVT
jgi:hypothetical protein